MIDRFSFLRPVVLGAALVTMGALAASAVVPADIERISLPPRNPDPNRQEGNLDSTGPISFSTDGRFVVFTSRSSNFYGNDQNDATDVFVRDRVNGFTELVSRGDTLTTNGVPGNRASYDGSISGDGRYVAFTSDADNLSSFGAQFLPDINGRPDVWVRDRRGVTVRVSGLNSIGSAYRPQISRDGKIVAFTSDSFGLVGGNLSTNLMVYAVPLDIDPTTGRLLGVRNVSNTFNGDVERLTDNAAGMVADGPSELQGISGDGRYVLFSSTAKNLDTDAASGASQLYLKDRQTGALQVVSRATNTLDDDGTAVTGAVGDAETTSAAMTPDARFVVFLSAASNLVEEDTNGTVDVFVRDLQGGTTERVSLNDLGEEADGDSSFVVDPTAFTGPVRPSISDDGRFVTFVSQATNLASGDNNQKADVFIRDRQAATTTRLSTTLGGLEGDEDSYSPQVSPNGQYVGFVSGSTNLVEGDTNTKTDVFLVDLGGAGGVDTGPVANAGSDQDVFENDIVTLDGSGTVQDAASPANFFWTQVSGPSVVLSDPRSPTPTFTAPLVGTSEELVFQLTTSDAAGRTTRDRVTVTVNTAAQPVTVTGTVRDAVGNPVVGASVEVVRTDGEAATIGTTDGLGTYTITDVRVGQNTVTVHAEGYEPEVAAISGTSGQTVLQNFTLDQTLARLQGSVLLSRGTPVTTGTVELLDGSGNVVGSSPIDSAGEYHIDNLDRSATTGATAIRIRTPQAPEWVSANPNLLSSTANVRDFRYGTVAVTVTGRPLNRVNRFLNGTRVDILVGERVLLSNRVTRNVRRLVFNNVPAVQVRVRGSNPRLTGSTLSVAVPEGPATARTTLVMRPRGIF